MLIHCCTTASAQYSMWPSIVSSLFTEPRREKGRTKRNRTKFMDIFWYSNVEDYKLLRFVINFPVGFGIGLLVYLFGWRRLNFLMFDPTAAEVLKWCMVLSSAIAFAWSAIFRCALLCVCLGALSQAGQALLSVMVVDHLSQDPMENIMDNFQLTSNIVACNLELQGRITAQRITLAAGPIEELLEKHFGNSTSIGRKMIHTLKALVEPFTGELGMNMEEDEALAALIDNAQAMSDREQLVYGEDNEEKEAEQFHASEVPSEELRPVWTRLKSKIGRAMGRRYTQRCQEMFASAIEKCHKKFQDAQSYCYESTPFFLAPFTCRRMNALDICKPTETNRAANKFCVMGEKLEDDNPLTPDLDEQMDSIQNISQQINEQLKLSVRFHLVEEPENDRIQVIDEIKTKIENDMIHFKIYLKIFQDVLSGLLVLLVYKIFKRNVRSIMSYLDNIEFRNRYITCYFRQIDAKRKSLGQETIGELGKQETKENNLMSPFGLPTFEELSVMWIAFLRWLTLFFVALIVVGVDYYYHRILHHAVSFGESHGFQQGEHTLEISIEGEGPIAEMLKDIVNFNYTATTMEDLTNEMCFSPPLAPNWKNISWKIFVPLLFMLLLQVFLTAFISRFTLIVVFGFIFRKQSKARVIHLYNKLLAERRRKVRRENLMKKILSKHNE